MSSTKIVYVFFNVRLPQTYISFLDNFMNLNSFVIYFVIFTIKIHTLKLHLSFLEDLKKATLQDHVEKSVSLNFLVQYMY